MTAIICASASEAARLVASFMSVSLDLGLMIHARVRHGFWARLIVARKGTTAHSDLLGNTPRRVFALIESPLSEHRRLIASSSNEAAIWPACSGFMRALRNFGSGSERVWDATTNARR